MQIVQRYACKSDCYNTNKKIEVKGLMLHSVGCNQPRSEAFVNQWNKAGVNVCANAVIDGLQDGLIIQTLPWEHRPWCAGGSANSTHIQVEMGEPDTIRYITGANFIVTNKAKAIAVAKRTYNTAVELFAYLCNKYKLDPLADGVIVSHSEGYKRGIASGHADPEHLWKQLGLSLSMDTFRKDVKDYLDKNYSKKENKEDNGYNLSNEKKTLDAIAKEVAIGKWGNGTERKMRLEQAGYDYAAVQKIVDSIIKGTYVEKPVESNKEIVPYLIRVTGQVNIYKDEKAKEIVGVAKSGVYTIIEENGSLGLLKSKAGWIRLGEVKKITG